MRHDVTLIITTKKEQNAMQIILLSGGSGVRLWPLSNEARSKQFLRVLETPNGGRESMVQRVVRQIKAADMAENITFATSISQKDIITNQLGEDISIVTEPCRRDTFPAIALAASYLAKEKKCNRDEVVVVMPCDSYTEAHYFETIRSMVKAVEHDIADLVLMGIKPTYPSAKYGYVVPQAQQDKDGLAYQIVSRFTEKPDVPTAEKLIAENAYWNGGVFAFRLGYMIDIVEKYITADSFTEIRNRYSEFPKISFDYEVAEKAKSVAVLSYEGQWKDLGTWNTLTDELNDKAVGNVILDDTTTNTHILNELEMPIMCIGAKDMIIAASHDGILISDKAKSENIKTYASKLSRRPMYEERRWGEYKVVDTIEFEDGHKALTKQLVIKAGKNISYQVHRHRDEVWTFIDGEGILVIDGEVRNVKRGDVVNIKKGTKHAVKAVTDLRFIEVQSGDQLVEEDIERFDWQW
jgi:mannose-1-phosphate guanylyltransferase